MVVLWFLSFVFAFELVSCSKDCANGEINVQKLNKMVESNGCSVPSFIKLNPYGQDFTECCDLHDACYAMCGIKQSFCDTDFGKCMNRLCETSEDPQCKETANMFTMGVTMFGQTGFAESQEDFCVCSESDESQLKSHYYSLISWFYAQFASGKPIPATVLSVLTPGDSDGSAANKYVKRGRNDELQHSYFKLYYSLHKKYPTSIDMTQKYNKQASML